MLQPLCVLNSMAHAFTTTVFPACLKCGSAFSLQVLHVKSYCIPLQESWVSSNLIKTPQETTFHCSFKQVSLNIIRIEQVVLSRRFLLMFCYKSKFPVTAQCKQTGTLSLVGHETRER